MESHERLRPVAEALATHVGGVVKIRGDAELHVAGTVQGLPVRIRLMLSMDDVDHAIDVRVTPPRWPLSIRYCADSQAHYQQLRTDWDTWDDEDAGGLTKIYVDDHIAYEGTTSTLESAGLAWQALPEDARTRVIETMNKSRARIDYGGTRLIFASTRGVPLDSEPFEDAVDPLPSLTKSVDFCVWLAQLLTRSQASYR
jgi:hypothetical protein